MAKAKKAEVSEQVQEVATEKVAPQLPKEEPKQYPKRKSVIVNGKTFIIEEY